MKMTIKQHVADMQNAMNQAQRAQALGLGLHYDRLYGKDRWAVRDHDLKLRYSTSSYECLRAWLSGFDAGRP